MDSWIPAFVFRTLILFTALMILPVLASFFMPDFYMPMLVESGVAFAGIMVWDAFHSLSVVAGYRSAFQTFKIVMLGNLVDQSILFLDHHAITTR